MIIKKFNILVFLILLLIFIISINTNLFKNIYNINSKSHDIRQQQAYDFCSKFGTGYVFYIKKKFNLENSPQIENYNISPKQYWIFLNSYKIIDQNKKIILNNKKDEKINLSKYKILDNFYDRCLFLEKK